jgi:hypothetical protein
VSGSGLQCAWNRVVFRRHEAVLESVLLDSGLLGHILKAIDPISLLRNKYFMTAI